MGFINWLMHNYFRKNKYIFTSLKWSKAARMISCPPLTRHTAASSSSTRALVLHDKDKKPLCQQSNAKYLIRQSLINQSKEKWRTLYTTNREISKGLVKWSYWFIQYRWQITEEIILPIKKLFMLSLTFVWVSGSYKRLSPIDFNQHSSFTIHLFAAGVTKE